MHVHIINLEGKSIFIDAEPEDVVKTVKKKIQARTYHYIEINFNHSFSGKS